MIDIPAIMKANRDEYTRFERVQNKLSSRADMHAFLLLDRICPGKSDMVAGASHDEIYLDPSPEDVAKIATEAEIIDLVRCGVRYQDDSFCMFA